MKYILEIYQPGSLDTAWVHIRSDHPFMTISAGELLNPGLWEGSQSPMRILRVRNVEHAVWETSRERGHRQNAIGHKIMVYTEEVSGDDPAIRWERGA